MRKIRIFLSVMLAVCFVAGIGISPIISEAAGEGLHLEGSNLSGGKMTFKVSGKLPSGNEGITSVGMYISYDASKMVLTSADGSKEYTASADAGAVTPLLKDSKGVPYRVVAPELAVEGGRGCIFVGLIPAGDEVSLNSTDNDLFSLTFKVNGELDSESIRIADPAKDKALIDKSKTGSKTASASIMVYSEAKDYCYGAIGTAFDPAKVEVIPEASVTKQYTGSDVKPSGTEVKGTITANRKGDAENVKVQLIKGTEVVKEAIAQDYTASGSTHTSSYTFTAVEPGDYTLKFVTDNAKRDITKKITVGAEAVIEDMRIYLLGDVNQNGKVDAIDVQRLYSHLNGSNKLDTGIVYIGDINLNGVINAIDIQRLYSHLNGSNKLF